MDASTLSAAPVKPTGSLERLFSIKDVSRITSLSETTIYRRMKVGDFPKPVTISPNRVAWPSSVIAQWQAKCLAA